MYLLSLLSLLYWRNCIHFILSLLQCDHLHYCTYTWEWKGDVNRATGVKQDCAEQIGTFSHHPCNPCPSAWVSNKGIKCLSSLYPYLCGHLLISHILEDTLVSTKSLSSRSSKTPPKKPFCNVHMILALC